MSSFPCWDRKAKITYFTVNIVIGIYRGGWCWSLCVVHIVELISEKLSKLWIKCFHQIIRFLQRKVQKFELSDNKISPQLHRNKRTSFYFVKSVMSRVHCTLFWWVVYICPELEWEFYFQWFFYVSYETLDKSWWLLMLLQGLYRMYEIWFKHFSSTQIQFPIT